MCGDGGYCSCCIDSAPEQPSAEKHVNPNEAAATHAANGYGWPAQYHTGDRHHTLERGDSYLEPRLARDFVGLPGSDFRSVYDPDRARQSGRPERPRSSTRSRHMESSYHRSQQRVSVSRPVITSEYMLERPTSAHGVIVDQPAYYEPMFSASSMPSIQEGRGMPRIPQVVHRRPDIMMPPRRAVIENAPYARPATRDSDGVSFCSIQDINEPPPRFFTPSPPIPSPSPGNANFYAGKGHGYGRNGAY
ncbi:hypothetical protein F4677DRAFT_18625 [Hypoxylon crocopeplum]|nr:hypothetical protein F4677DRAFT_18625 [Hypoxylon crocopeplum]